MRDDRNSKLLALHAARITETLKDLGADAYDMRLPETNALHYIINPSERILGIVYGRYLQLVDGLAGRGALVATNSRIFLVDRKPFFVQLNELSYRAVSGVAYGRMGLVGTVTLHSKTGDIRVRTMNQLCARSFVRAVEARLYEEA